MNKLMTALLIDISNIDEVHNFYEFIVMSIVDHEHIKKYYKQLCHQICEDLIIDGNKQIDR